MYAQALAYVYAYCNSICTVLIVLTNCYTTIIYGTELTVLLYYGV